MKDRHKAVLTLTVVILRNEMQLYKRRNQENKTASVFVLVPVSVAAFYSFSSCTDLPDDAPCRGETRPPKSRADASSFARSSGMRGDRSHATFAGHGIFGLRPV